MTHTENSQKTNRTFLGKMFFITGIVALSAGIAYGSSFLINKSWVAEAKVERPDVAALGNYYTLSSTYQFIHNKENALSATDIAYHEFIRQLTSEKAKRHFWQTSEYYKQKQTGEDPIDLILLEKLISSIQFEMASSNTFADTIRLELDNPKLATELLSSYIEYINQETRKVIYSDLITQWKVLFERIKKATELNLGKNGSTTNSADDWQGKLQMMRAVNPLDEQFTAYRYSKQPTQPVSHYTPNRLGWGMIGGIIGLFIALLLSSTFNLRKKNN